MKREKLRKAQIIQWEASNVPKRHRIVKQDKLVHPEWNSRFARIEPLLGTGAIIGIVGGRGRGKTQMAVHAIRTSIKAGRDAYYTKAIDVFIDMRSSYRQNSGVSESAIIKQFTRYGLLVIDALEEKSDSDWENRMLSHIIDKRYDEMVDTILISNETPEAFSKSHGSSIMDRLQETGGIIECAWPSFRSIETP